MMEPLQLTEDTKRYLDLLKQALTGSLYDESAWMVMEAEKSSGWRALLKPHVLMRSGLVRFLRKQSVVLVKQQPYDPEIRDSGEDWPLIGYTMVGLRRLDNVWACVEQVLRTGVPGDLIETGAWRGGTTMFMRALLRAYGITDRAVWVADSFEGMPIPASRSDGWDLSEVQYLKVSLESVKRNFQKFDLLDDQVHFLRGWFTWMVQRVAPGCAD
jgi:O-methyltransferase